MTGFMYKPHDVNQEQSKTPVGNKKTKHNIPCAASPSAKITQLEVTKVKE